MTLSEVWEQIDLHTSPGGVETIILDSAFGRISARSVFAHSNMPPFDVSALDGYAVVGQGSVFSVEGALEPFQEPPERVEEGKAFFIPTGGRLPSVCRFVTRERTREGNDTIEVETLGDERRIVKAGDWLKEGVEVIIEGAPVDATAMASLSLAGHKMVEVYRKPAVAVVTTGSELKRGRLIDSNRFLLAGLVQRDGGELREFHVADDTEDEILTVLSGLRQIDLLILTGGTSKGRKDLTKKVVKRWGGSFYVESPAVSPGKTMALGEKDRTTFCILPGNPKAVRTVYEVFVRRILSRMEGRRLTTKEQLLPLPRKLRKTKGIATITSALLEIAVSGLRELHPREPDAFVVVEENDCGDLPKGERVKVIIP
jgi:molybdenum cofactor synthesis domain-containing protein